MGSRRQRVSPSGKIGVVAALFVFYVSPIWSKPAYSIHAGSESDLLFRGANPWPMLGLSIAPLGDVNNDGHADFAIGAPGANRVFIVLGRPFARGIVELFTTSPLSGVIIVTCNTSQGNGFGCSVSSAGDFNGDGVRDIVMGWPGCNVRAPRAGAAVVVFGKPAWSKTAPAVVLDVSSASPQNAVIFYGSLPDDEAGACVAGGGDLKNDGFDDIVIASPAAIGGANVGGKFYVVFGGAAPASRDLEPVGPWGCKIASNVGAALARGTSSTVCAWPGDLNRDGFDDLLLGTPLHVRGTTETGAAWVLFGHAGPTTPSMLLTDIGLKIPGVHVLPDPAVSHNALVGFTVAGVGDVNRDGVPDFAVGAPRARWAGNGGVVAVVYGAPALQGTIELTSFSGRGFFVINREGDPRDWFGASVAAAGDPNNDGVPDLLIGALGGFDPATQRMGPGHAYVVYCGIPTKSIVLLAPKINEIPDSGFSHTDQMGQTLDVSIVDIVGVFGSPSPEGYGDLFGWSLCCPGDLNDDGVDDILIGSPMSRSTYSPMSAHGDVFGFFFEPPRITGVYLDDTNGNRLADSGEFLNIVLDQRVLAPTDAEAGVFFLTGGARLSSGSVLSQSRPGSNRVQVRLDNPAGIVVPGPATALDISATGPRNRIVSRRLGVNPMDSGLPWVNDTGIDVRFSMLGAGRSLSPAGGLVSVPFDPDSRYTGHQIELLPGALSTTAMVELRQPPDPPGSRGLGSAVWVSISSPFTRARLTLAYQDGDVPPGFDERQMRIVAWVESAPGVSEWRMVGGQQTVDPLNNMITVFLDSFPPTVLGSPQLHGSGGSGLFAGLPIETVDERSQGMEPKAGAPVQAVQVGLVESPGVQASVILTPGPMSLYPKHKLVFYNYATSTPGSVIVTLRSAATAERTFTNPVIGSQYFPDASEALFTVETTNAAHTPIPLTSPVDLQIEYQTVNPHHGSDVMDFNGNPASWQQMRVVRSVQNPENSIPNFTFVGGVQQVDNVNKVVTLSGFTNLTDSQGKATYGLIANTSPARARRWEAYR